MFDWLVMLEENILPISTYLQLAIYVKWQHILILLIENSIWLQLCCLQMQYYIKPCCRNHISAKIGSEQHPLNGLLLLHTRTTFPPSQKGVSWHLYQRGHQTKTLQGSSPWGRTGHVLSRKKQPGGFCQWGIFILLGCTHEECVKACSVSRNPGQYKLSCRCWVHRAWLISAETTEHLTTEALC